MIYHVIAFVSSTNNFVCLADDLEKRKRLRQKKARDEKRREKRIEMEENRKQGKCEDLIPNCLLCF